MFVLFRTRGPEGRVALLFKELAAVEVFRQFVVLVVQQHVRHLLQRMLLEPIWEQIPILFFLLLSETGTKTPNINFYLGHQNFRLQAFRVEK